MVGLFGKESTPFSSCFTFYRLLISYVLCLFNEVDDESIKEYNKFLVKFETGSYSIPTLICPDLAYCNPDDIQECESVHYVVYCSKIIGLGQIVSIRRNGEQESNPWLESKPSSRVGLGGY